jgi:PAS domain-containing protein
MTVGQRRIERNANRRWERQRDDGSPAQLGARAERGIPHQHGENMPPVVFAKDSATCRFILLNRAGEEFLGIPCAATIGKTNHYFFPKEKADRFIARDRRTLQSRLSQAVEKRRKAGYA